MVGSHFVFHWSSFRDLPCARIERNVVRIRLYGGKWQYQRRNGHTFDWEIIADVQLENVASIAVRVWSVIGLYTGARPSDADVSMHSVSVRLLQRLLPTFV